MSRKVQILFSALTFILLGWYGLLLQQTILLWIFLVAMALTYMVIIWVPSDWWTRSKYGLVVVTLIALAVCLHLPRLGGSQLPTGLLLAPLVLLLAREQPKYPWFSVMLVVVTLTGIGILSPSVSFAWTALPLILSLYMTVRAINIYKEAYRLSQQKVAELSAAHHELQQTYAALQEATVRSMRYAALTERARLARDIHDGLGHQLTSLIVQLQALEIMLPGDPSQAALAVPGMLSVAHQAMDEVHRAVKTWREDEGSDGLVALQGLVTQFATTAPFNLEFHQDGNLSNWPVELSVELYRILQEALTNILRHAQASTARIQVQERDELVILTISDDGRYSENTPLIPGYGIKGIQERCQALGGVVRIIQNDPRGLRLQVEIPIVAAQAVAFQPLPGRRSAHG